MSIKGILGTIGITILFIISLIIFFGSFYTINQGDRGIVLRWGKVVKVADAGINFKIPVMDQVREMSIRTIKIEKPIQTYSKDIQAADVGFSLNYSINPANIQHIYSQYGLKYWESIIIPQILAKPKDVFGKYNAVDIVQNREKLTAEILTELQKFFSNTGIFIESVQIENIDFSNEYEKSVEERMKAEVEVQRVRQNLEREKLNADMVRTQAKGEADAMLTKATANAEAIKLEGSAQAYVIEQRSEVLAKNPEYVRLIEAERWNGILPTTILPTNTLPIINTK
jgi:Membrane protease subunits, stomatin/prohibitin homologs